MWQRLLQSRNAKRLQTLLFGVASLWLLLVVAWMIPATRTLLFQYVIGPVLIDPAHRMESDSKYVLGDFYQHCKARRYSEAHALFSVSAQKQLPQSTLLAQWQAFEKVHGAIRNFLPPGRGTIGSGKVNLYPHHVTWTHRVTAQRGEGRITVRMVPENRTWRVDSMTLKP
jgi:hypothetical protein